MARRHAGFTLRTECTSCGMPLPVDRPTRETTCGQCDARVRIPEEIWRFALDLFEGERRPPVGKMLTVTDTVAGFRIHLQVANIDPRCEKCAGLYPMGDLASADSTDFACPSCGDPASAWPAPSWLRNLAPTCTQLVSTSPGGGQRPEGTPLETPVEEAVKPVAMSCPQCAGSLRITAEHERIVPCQYCGTDVFLPDEVWRRLHPVRTVQWFYATFEGKTALERAADREAAEAARDAERKQQRAALAFEKMPVAWAVVATFAAWQVCAPVLIVKRASFAHLVGSTGNVFWALLGITAVLYVVAVVAAARPLAIANGGTWRGHAIGFGVGGLIFLPPAAGIVFALIAIIMARVMGDPKEPASGVGRPMVVTYVTFAVFPQFTFFYFA